MRKVERGTFSRPCKRCNATETKWRIAYENAVFYLDAKCFKKYVKLLPEREREVAGTQTVRH